MTSCVHKIKVLSFVLVALFIATNGNAGDYRYSLSIQGGMVNLSSGEQGPYTLQNSFAIGFGYHPSPHWHWSLDYSRMNLDNDTSASSSFSVSHNKDFATQTFSSGRLGLSIRRKLFDPQKFLNLSLGIGTGLLIWEITTPGGDSLLKVPGEKNQTFDYKATEIFAGISAQVELSLTPRLSLISNTGLDYLTGAGVEFAPEVESARERQLFSTYLGIRLHFGAVSPVWKSEKTWADNTPGNRRSLDFVDSDGDNVPDSRDNCPNSRPGSLVDERGCPLDSDGDGVIDGFDDCPNSDRRALGMVDIHGCPVDSDFDGVPDYLDQCPQNDDGADVKENGCPKDSDGDGVADGLDDCPHTLVGVDVDRFGCIDLAMLAEPMILHIDYTSGSFEIDFRTKEKLERLSRLLNFVGDVKLEISGFTDNIGATLANRELSLKRARRVRDFLLRNGIESDRMEVFGRGEDNFIASNDTADGRAKNRRVEIVFLR